MVGEPAAEIRRMTTNSHRKRQMRVKGRSGLKRLEEALMAKRAPIGVCRGMEELGVGMKYRSVHRVRAKRTVEAEME